MAHVDRTVLEQMQVDEADITLRKDLLGFTASDRVLLLECRSFMETGVDHVIEKLYASMTTFDEVTRLLDGNNHTTDLLQAQRQYILELFDGLYEIDYVKNRQWVGLVHQQIGLQPKLYLSAISQLKQMLYEVIDTQIEDRTQIEATCQALDKLLYFDTTLVLDTFILAVMKRLESAKEHVALEARDFEEKARHFKDLSQRDSLTNLYNHGAFQAFLSRDLLQAQRRHEPLALIYFDLDNFKNVNDTEGHAAGDAVLKTVAQTLAEVCRKVDVLCRYGGDEFCVILPSCDLEGAEQVCYRIIETFCSHHKNISISFGISQTGPDNYASFETLCFQTDQKMYRAKKRPGFHIQK